MTNNNFIARSFFVFRSDKNTEQCKICKKCFKGSFTSNMKKHLLESHNAAYLSEIKENQDGKPAAKKRKVKISISQEEMIKVSELMTEHIPSDVLQMDIFQSLTKQFLDGLDMSPKDIKADEK